MAPGCRVPVSVPSGMVVSAVGVIQAAVRVPGSGETVGPGFLLWGSRESSLPGPPSSPPPRGLGASHPPEGLKLFPRSFMLRKKKSRRLTIHHGVVMRGASSCPQRTGGAGAIGEMGLRPNPGPRALLVPPRLPLRFGKAVAQNRVACAPLRTCFPPQCSVRAPPGCPHRPSASQSSVCSEG